MNKIDLNGRCAVVTGGAQGFGRAITERFVGSGAKVAIWDHDLPFAEKTAKEIGNGVTAFKVDVSDLGAVEQTRDATLKAFGKIDILVNNAAEQHPQDSITRITERQLERTFRTNIFSLFFMTKAVMPHFKKGGNIINTTSVTAYQGSPQLLDYSSTKGAIVAFTRSLSQTLADKKIRVNAVAPGPIWTPLIPSTFPAKETATFGSDTPLGRAGRT
jgi:NAD(P)-dependent dehydrogenase (short-subunit alcohol dehydrogenase family)